MHPKFHPVIRLPETYEIFDFSKGYSPEKFKARFGVGRYNEDRKGMYTTALFSPDAPEARTVHMGVDIAAPAATEVFAFDDGVIFMTGINSAPGDYGGTLITLHNFEGRRLWALYGHLSHLSVELRKAGEKIFRGDRLGWLGDEKENGGWNPHVHFQLSWVEPLICDLPGVVSAGDRNQALTNFPDPRIVLGPLYTDFDEF